MRKTSEKKREKIGKKGRRGRKEDGEGCWCIDFRRKMRERGEREEGVFDAFGKNGDVATDKN